MHSPFPWWKKRIYRRNNGRCIPVNESTIRSAVSIIATDCKIKNRVMCDVAYKTYEDRVTCDMKCTSDDKDKCIEELNEIKKKRANLTRRVRELKYELGRSTQVIEKDEVESKKSCGQFWNRDRTECRNNIQAAQNRLAANREKKNKLDARLLPLENQEEKYKDADLEHQKQASMYLEKRKQSREDRIRNSHRGTDSSRMVRSHPSR